MACINNAKPYNVTINGESSPTPGPTWFDQQGGQSGRKTMIIRNTGSNAAALNANQPNYAYAAGYYFAAGDILILKNVHATVMKWYAVCSGTNTTTFSILEVTP